MSEFSQYVRRLHVVVPETDWGKPFACLHKLNDGNGSGYTPRMAAVTQVYVVDANDLPHPVESSVVRVVTVDAKNVYLIVGDVGGTRYRTAYTEVLGSPPKAALVVVEVRLPVSSEIGRAALGDESVGLPTDVGLPISLLARK
jgi:hypothetical protein